jgi:hypothetical protein
MFSPRKSHEDNNHWVRKKTTSKYSQKSVKFTLEIRFHVVKNAGTGSALKMRIHNPVLEFYNHLWG